MIKTYGLQLDYGIPSYTIDLKKFKNEMKEKKVCDICLGTGEVAVMEQVYANEPHYAPIGTKACICQINDSDDQCRD